MDIKLVTQLIDAFGYVVYASLAVLAVWGSYNVVLLYRVLGKKRMRPEAAREFLQKVRDALRSPGQLQAAVDVCHSPPYWHKALSQLTGVALQTREKGMARVKQALPIEFHAEVASQVERRLGTISTIAKMGPLVGLLGTVLSMIEAFGRMGEGEKANPTDLAAAISLGLWATAGGLLIATTLMMLGSDLHNRLRALRDQTEKHLPDVVELVESIGPGAFAAKSPGGARPSQAPASAKWGPG